MNTTKLMVYLTPEERRGLQKAAEKDFRPMRDQARMIIRNELQRRGLLIENIKQPGPQILEVENAL